MVHDITVREYKIRHGFPLSTGLITRELRDHMSQVLRETDNGERLRRVSQPTRARLYADPAMQERGQRLWPRVQRGD